jgi:hypothetical protein
MKNYKLLLRQVALRGPLIMRKMCGARRKNYELVVPAFSLAPAVGITTSSILAIASVPIASAWSIRYPITRPSSTFVAVVRFARGAAILRYKLWSGVGEVAPFPTYIGETLPAGAAIEIWSVPGVTAVLPAAWVLPLGLMELPVTPCDADGADVNPTMCVPTGASSGSLAELMSACPN